MKYTMKELWFPIIVSICIAALVKAFLDFFLLFKRSKSAISRSKGISLPPEGPFFANRVPFIGGFLWLRKSASEVEATLRSVHSKCGNSSAITVRFTSRPSIFVFSRSLAHKALVQSGSIFADRPKPLETARIMSSNQHSINSAGYCDMWRILRRNLTSQILHPSRIQAYSEARSWVLGILIDRLMLQSDGKSGSSLNQAGAVGVTAVRVIDHFRYAMFCLLVLMCFGDKLEEDEIKKVESVQHNLLMSFRRFQVLNVRPWLTRIIFRGRWKLFFDLRKNQHDVIIPLIERRRWKNEAKNHSISCYVDSLLELEVPDGDINDDGYGNTLCKKKRKLSEMEMVSCCSEFLNAGTDTTTTTLQWIMANLVKYPHIQAKLYDEIKGVAGSNEPHEEAKQVIKEEELGKMNYLKAVVLEGLRRHPPAHFLLPHAVTQDVELDSFFFPKDAVINFMVAELGWDSNVWEDPMQFKPERFLPCLSSSNGFDITGSRDIKMMPFGVGRRICPAFSLAILHLEYFVANLIWKFEWKSADGCDVDLSEEQVFTVVMKHPLHVCVIPRVGVQSIH